MMEAAMGYSCFFSVCMADIENNVKFLMDSVEFPRKTSYNL